MTETTAQQKSATPRATSDPTPSLLEVAKRSHESHFSTVSNAAGRPIASIGCPLCHQAALDDLRRAQAMERELSGQREEHFALDARLIGPDAAYANREEWMRDHITECSGCSALARFDATAQRLREERDTASTDLAALRSTIAKQQAESEQLAAIWNATNTRKDATIAKLQEQVNENELTIQKQQGVIEAARQAAVALDGEIEQHEAFWLQSRSHGAKGAEDFDFIHGSGIRLAKADLEALRAALDQAPAGGSE